MLKKADASSTSSSSSTSSNRKPLIGSTLSTVSSSLLLSKSRDLRSLTYSNSLRSNRTGTTSSHCTVSSIKKTNSFSSLDSSALTNSLSSKLPRTGALTKPYSTATTHFKAPVKATRSLIDTKLSPESPQLENGPTSSTGTQENGDQTGKLSKRLSKSKAPISSSTSTAKVIEFIDGNEVASTSANEATSSSSHSEAKAADPAVSLPGCSRSLNSSRTGAPESNRSTSNSHHSSNSVLASVDSHLSISSDDDSNSDELGGLEANKCNIADDSDDSASHKSISSRFSTSKMHLDPSLTTSQNFKQLASSQPVNQALTSPQSNAVNSSDVQLNNSSSGKSPSNSVKSIRNGGNAVPLRNTCHVHRSSISSNDLMMSSSSSNYVPSHRLLHSSSYNASPSHCCHFRHHHHSHRVDSMIPVSSLRQQQQQQCQLANHKNPFDLGMSSIEATSIISSHCNTENNNSNAPNSAAITKLTSSSFSGLPVATLTVMQSPNLSSSRHGTYNWQAFMSTLKDRMATIFNCELLADVHFIVGKGNTQTRFPAHKFVLSIGSAVFDAMFNGPLTKAALTVESHKHSELRSTGDDTEIELPDIEPEAFQALLRFLYLDEVQIGPETVMTTLYAAKKYEVPALEMACVDFLKANLNPDNAFMMLTQARLFDENTLADLCLETIDKHTMDSLFSDSFFDIDLDTLKLVLDRDSLRVREVSLFLAAMRWAEFECTRRSLELNSENKRKVLGDALYLIRFPLMSIEEFAHNVAQSELLTDKEVVNLFLYFTVSSKPTVPFPIEPRCCITGEECSVNRFQRTESRWGYSGTSDRIRFLTDRPIFVIGFGLFGSIHGGSEYEAIIEVIHTGSGKVLASNTTSFVSDGSDSTFRVMFKYPVEITQNTNYTACATLKGVDSYYGTNGYRTVTVNLGKGDSKESVTFQFSYAAGCNNGTSVEDGQIPQILFYT